MKVTFPGGLAQYFKPDTKPEQYESLSEGLIERCELIVVAKNAGIDSKCVDWWSPWDKETSQLRVVCLNDNGRIDPPTHSCDVLIVKSEDGADVIKAVDDISVSFKAEVYFNAGLENHGMFTERGRQIRGCNHEN